MNEEEIPVVMQTPDTIMRTHSGYGGMTVAYNEIPAGTDFTPLLQGLHNDSCHCPHWGYVVKGTMRVVYNDGQEELLKEGDVYFLPAGHTAKVEEDAKLIEFSAEKEFGEVMEHVGKKMAEMSQ